MLTSAFEVGDLVKFTYDQGPVLGGVVVEWPLAWDEPNPYRTAVVYSGDDYVSSSLTERLSFDE